MLQSLTDLSSSPGEPVLPSSIIDGHSFCTLFQVIPELYIKDKAALLYHSDAGSEMVYEYRSSTCRKAKINSDMQVEIVRRKV
jgi:hypothetical protein